MEMVTGAADRQGSEDEGVVSVGDWWMEGGISMTAIVHVGKTPPSSEPSEDHRSSIMKTCLLPVTGYGIQDTTYIVPSPRVIVRPKKRHDDLRGPVHRVAALTVYAHKALLFKESISVRLGTEPHVALYMCNVVSVSFHLRVPLSK